jgi:regulator of protease activity HflC (stomatin/prohibitin superfamily)
MAWKDADDADVTPVTRRFNWQLPAGILLALVVTVILNPVYIVRPGEVAVTFNRVTGTTASHAQGLHFRIPLVHGLEKFDVKTQRIDIVADAASKDLQHVKIDCALNYHLLYEKVNNLFVKVGKDYKVKIIDPAVNESLKSSVSQYPVEDIIVKREELRRQIEAMLAERLAQYNLILESLNLVNISFTPEFNQVVEQKQIEEQKIRTAQYQRMQAEEKKKQTILEAEGEARKQELLKQTVSEKGISLQWIAKWDGHLPQYMLGEKTSILLTPKSDTSK